MLRGLRVSEEVEEGQKGVQIRVSAAYLGSILADMGSQGADTCILGVSWAYPGAKGQIQYPYVYPIRIQCILDNTLGYTCIANVFGVYLIECIPHMHFICIHVRILSPKFMYGS